MVHGGADCGDFHSVYSSGLGLNKCVAATYSDVASGTRYAIERSFGAAFQSTQMNGAASSAGNLHFAFNVTYVPVPGSEPSVAITARAAAVERFASAAAAASLPSDMAVDFACGSLIRHMDSIWVSSQRVPIQMNNTVFGQPVLLGATHYDTKTINTTIPP